ncbi:hypothetical protein KC614_02095 [candidate division WWE3 bacterium]|uniref:Uncharacterized protein n=1 Tax=candidate division WWE3 bacterium TaxID=2053526 RepID=A0A955LK64_UNCKA|nr:hypothetical protein [candidate division WWE3 bacterium]
MLNEGGGRNYKVAESEQIELNSEDVDKYISRMMGPDSEYYKRKRAYLKGLVELELVDPGLDPEDLLQDVTESVWRTFKDGYTLEVPKTVVVPHEEEGIDPRVMVSLYAYLNTAIQRRIWHFFKSPSVRARRNSDGEHTHIPMEHYTKDYDHHVTDGDDDVRIAGDLIGMSNEHLKRMYPDEEMDVVPNRAITLAAVDHRDDFDEIRNELLLDGIDIVNDDMALHLILIDSRLRDLMAESTPERSKAPLDKYRIAVMHVIGEIPIEKTAEMLDTTVSNVYVIRTRAKDWLRTNVGKQHLFEIFG